MRDVNLASIQECIDRCLQLLDRSYSSISPDAGGWYHRLEADVPGPSATAVALHSYLLAGRIPARLSEGLTFLASRQVTSSDEPFNGGWPVNTSSGIPVLEATSLVLRFLGSGHLVAGHDVPDIKAAHRWVVSNQNPDGGWGSFAGQPSRVWLTAMAVRALVEININDAAIASATEWLVRERDPATLCWGERPQSSATVTHTGFVLSCLVDSRIASHRPHIAEAIRKGFAWLPRHLDVNTIFDDAARVESYNVSYTTGDRTATWQNSIWHPGLPFALSALVRDPNGADLRLISAIVHKILSSQLEGGRWPNADGAAGISVWSVWPFVDALSDFARMIPIRNANRITWFSADSVLVRRKSDSAKSLLRLWFSSAVLPATAVLKRRWAIVLLLVTMAAAIILWLTGVLALKESVLTLTLPVALVFLQELVLRNRAS
jgi:hypothetical protein